MARGPQSLEDIRYLMVKPLDLAILLWNVMRAKDDPEIGFEDAEISFDYFMKNQNKPMPIKRQALESALWSCNMRAEGGKFEHHEGITFEQFTARILKGNHANISFDKFYNLLYVRGDNADKRRIRKPGR